MITIQDYVNESLNHITSQALQAKLGISASMVSAYKKSYNPSLAVAITVYKLDKIVLHPFSEESLKYEIQNKAGNTNE